MQGIINKVIKEYFNVNNSLMKLKLIQEHLYNINIKISITSLKRRIKNLEKQ